MAFKMKGPTFFNVGKKGKYAKQNPSAAFQHNVDDNPEHQETYGDDHSDDLQTEEEHKAGKIIPADGGLEKGQGDLEKGGDRTHYNSLVKKEKDGSITKSEQSALDRLRAEEG